MSDKQTNHYDVDNHYHYEDGGAGDTYTTERHDHHHTNATARSGDNAAYGGAGGRSSATGNRNHIQIDNRAGGLTTGMLVVGSVAVVGMLALALAAFAAALVAVSVVLAGLAGTSGLALAKMHYDARGAPHRYPYLTRKLELEYEERAQERALAHDAWRVEVATRERLALAQVQRPALPAPQVETLDRLVVESREYAGVRQR